MLGSKFSRRTQLYLSFKMTRPTGGARMHLGRAPSPAAEAGNSMHLGHVSSSWNRKSFSWSRRESESPAASFASRRSRATCDTWRAPPFAQSCKRHRSRDLRHVADVTVRATLKTWQTQLLAQYTAHAILQTPSRNHGKRQRSRTFDAWQTTPFARPATHGIHHHPRISEARQNPPSEPGPETPRGGL